MLEEKKNKKENLKDWKLENWVKEKSFFLLRQKHKVMYESLQDL